MQFQYVVSGLWLSSKTRRFFPSLNQLDSTVPKNAQADEIRAVGFHL